MPNNYDEMRVAGFKAVNTVVEDSSGLTADFSYALTGAQGQDLSADQEIEISHSPIRLRPEAVVSTAQGSLLQSMERVNQQYSGALANEIVVRGDKRPPQELSATGFRAWGADSATPGSDIASHVYNYSAYSQNTAFISTSRCMELAFFGACYINGEAADPPQHGYVYAMAVNGVVANPAISHVQEARRPQIAELVRRHGALGTQIEKIELRRGKLQAAKKPDDALIDKLYDQTDELSDQRGGLEREELFQYARLQDMDEGSRHDQAEVAAVLHVPWDNILAFRRVSTATRRFDSPLFLRESLVTSPGARRVGPDGRKWRALVPSRAGFTLAALVRLCGLFQIKLDQRVISQADRGFIVTSFAIAAGTRRAEPFGTVLYTSIGDAKRDGWSATEPRYLYEFKKSALDTTVFRVEGGRIQLPTELGPKAYLFRLIEKNSATAIGPTLLLVAQAAQAAAVLQKAAEPRPSPQGQAAREATTQQALAAARSLAATPAPAPQVIKTQSAVSCPKAPRSSAKIVFTQAVQGNTLVDQDQRYLWPKSRVNKFTSYSRCPHCGHQGVANH